MSLDEIGRKHGTDKTSEFHDYLKVYEQYLSPHKDAAINLLEVGWLQGASVKTWRDYFSQANITGIDIDAKDPITGVNFAHGSQDDKAFIDKTASEYGPWNVIIDDASHICSLTIATFKHLWPHLNSGGLYFVEDLQVSYIEHWEGNPHPYRAGSKGQTSMQFLRGLADHVHYMHSGIKFDLQNVYDVEMVAFHPGLAVVKKR